MQNKLCIITQKSEQFMQKCTIAQCCALSEYRAKHNCALWPTVLSVVHIYVVQHVNCAIVHYLEQFVPTLAINSPLYRAKNRAKY